MRRRFTQVLQSVDDERMTDVVLRFWTRGATPVRTQVRDAENQGAQVVDLARWAERRTVQR